MCWAWPIVIPVFEPNGGMLSEQTGELYKDANVFLFTIIATFAS